MEGIDILFWIATGANYILWFVSSRLSKKSKRLLEETHKVEIENLERKFHLYQLVGTKLLHKIVFEVGQSAYEAGLSEKTMEQAQSGVDSILNTLNIKKESELDEDED